MLASRLSSKGRPVRTMSTEHLLVWRMPRWEAEHSTDPFLEIQKGPLGIGVAMSHDGPTTPPLLNFWPSYFIVYLFRITVWRCFLRRPPFWLAFKRNQKQASILGFPFLSLANSPDSLEATFSLPPREEALGLPIVGLARPGYDLWFA